MPKCKPRSGEKRNDFVSRCVPLAIAEGKTQDQAVGMCEGIFTESKKSLLGMKLTKALKAVSDVCGKMLGFGHVASDVSGLEVGTKDEAGEHKGISAWIASFYKDEGRLPSDEEIAERIAGDHIKIDPAYYDETTREV